MLKAIIIDDSQTSIDALLIKLQRHCADVQVVLTSTHPQQAAEAISFHKPDIIFLDIEMPSLNGFQVAAGVQQYTGHIVFVTAYDQYAIEAIRAHAFDYLLKPVNVQELKQCVARLKEKIQSSQTGANSPLPDVLHQLLSKIGNASGDLQAVSLPSGEGMLVVPLEEICWLESVNNYTRFHLTGNRKQVVSRTIGDYEEILKNKHFMRIHRSHIINIRHLHKYHRADGGFVELKDGTQLEISVRKKQELLDKLKDLPL